MQMKFHCLNKGMNLNYSLYQSFNPSKSGAISNIKGVKVGTFSSKRT
nr:hypothetical protein [uncultured Methanobrevibacter sp.]